MGRAPCCDKIGLKKGPWTPEEDLILINHINTFGHKNWRALPKQAGLLRCGKSCRLRWTNYLRPDIKRGNFTREEEDTIIKLHQMLGNRWSAIAARLAGRTDNEIKNVWHTRLKKRLRLRLPVPQQETETERPDRKPNAKQMMQSALDAPKYNYQHPRPTQEQGPVNQNFPTTTSTTRHVDHVIIEAESTAEEMPLYSSPRCLSSDMSTFTTSTDSNDHNTSTVNCDVSLNNNSAADSLVHDFWSEVLSADNSNETSGFLAINGVACKNYDVGATHTHV